MDYESLTPRSFTDKELAASLRFYTDCRADGFEPFSSDFQERFRCSRNRAEVLRNAAAWAYKIKQKEKIQMQAKRKRAS